MPPAILQCGSPDLARTRSAAVFVIAPPSEHQRKEHGRCVTVSSRFSIGVAADRAGGSGLPRSTEAAPWRAAVPHLTTTRARARRALQNESGKAPACATKKSRNNAEMLPSTFFVSQSRLTLTIPCCRKTASTGSMTEYERFMPARI